jgi:hypothetical protein
MTKTSRILPFHSEKRREVRGAVKDLSEYLSELHSEHGKRRKVGNAGGARYSAGIHFPLRPHSAVN